jgi:hypothetical protein
MDSKVSQLPLNVSDMFHPFNTLGQVLTRCSVWQGRRAGLCDPATFSCPQGKNPLIVQITARSLHPVPKSLLHIFPLVIHLILPLRIGPVPLRGRFDQPN